MLNFFRLTILLLAFVSCNSGNSKLIEEYKMINYESKAWVDSLDFPIIEIINNKTFEIYKRNILKYKGKIELANTDTFLVLNDYQKLKIVFLDISRKKVRVSRLTDIDVEAKYGDFIRIQ